MDLPYALWAILALLISSAFSNPLVSLQISNRFSNNVCLSSQRVIRIEIREQIVRFPININTFAARNTVLNINGITINVNNAPTQVIINTFGTTTQTLTSTSTSTFSSSLPSAQVGSLLQAGSFGESFASSVAAAATASSSVAVPSSAATSGPVAAGSSPTQVPAPAVASSASQSVASDFLLAVGGAAGPAATQSSVARRHVEPSKRVSRRQTINTQLLSESSNATTNECSQAKAFQIRQGQLFRDGNIVSVDPGTPNALFSSLGSTGSITTEFGVAGDDLQWVNPQFSNGAAYFCQVPSGDIYAIFAAEPIVPNCANVSLSRFLRAQCPPSSGATTGSISPSPFSAGSGTATEPSVAPTSIPNSASQSPSSPGSASSPSATSSSLSGSSTSNPSNSAVGTSSVSSPSGSTFGSSSIPSTRSPSSSSAQSTTGLSSTSSNVVSSTIGSSSSGSSVSTSTTASLSSSSSSSSSSGIVLPTTSSATSSSSSNSASSITTSSSSSSVRSTTTSSSSSSTTTSSTPSYSPPPNPSCPLANNSTYQANFNQTFVVECDRDYAVNSNDIRNDPTSDAGACIQSCAAYNNQNPQAVQCVASVYLGSICYLKSSAANPVFKAGVVSARLLTPRNTTSTVYSPPPPPTCPTANNSTYQAELGQTFVVECDRDYAVNSNDIRNRAEPDIGSCIQSCNIYNNRNPQADQCVAVVYKNSFCFLKSSAANPIFRLSRPGQIGARLLTPTNTTSTVYSPPPNPTCPAANNTTYEASFNQTFLVECNTDYSINSNDIGNSQQPNAGACIQACAAYNNQNPQAVRCLASAFVGTSCFLKSSAANPAFRPGYVSARLLTSSNTTSTSSSTTSTSSSTTSTSSTTTSASTVPSPQCLRDNNASYRPTSSNQTFTITCRTDYVASNLAVINAIPSVGDCIDRCASYNTNVPPPTQQCIVAFLATDSRCYLKANRDNPVGSAGDSGLRQ
ncbi:MAG: hypothetical protein M1817_005571 [Caeruleum heppii]|nr:MAG: hypothetical protein M1817_005571 [Caeruleum heppii]